MYLDEMADNIKLKKKNDSYEFQVETYYGKTRG